MGNVIDNLELENALTFFMVPFYYKGTTFSLKDSLWVEEKSKLMKSDYLFPYIMKFLQGQMDGITNPSERLSIYALNEESEFFKKAWKRLQDGNVVNLDKNGTEVKFSLQPKGKNGFKKPHLFVSEPANIGILSFCMELENKYKTMQNLKMFNYVMHKIDSQAPMCQNVNMMLRDTDNDNGKASKEKARSIARKYIAPHTEKKPSVPETAFSWDVKTLIDGFIENFEIFTPPRVHVFTFAQIDDSQDNDIELDDIKLDLFKLSKCETDEYNVIDDEDVIRDVLQTYKNIYVSSSVSGTTMIAIAQSQNRGFITNMDNDSLPRYLWIYMLTLIQRFSLMYLDIRITEVLKKKDSEELWSLLDTICSVKIRCLYSEVSPFSQHNKFYQYCCKSFNIDGHYGEIDSKTQLMMNVINHNEQLLEEENDRNTEKGQRRLNIVVAFLTIAQVADAFYSLTNNNISYAVSSAVFAVIIICLIFMDDIKKMI